MMKIDKEVGDIAYNDELHKYWSKSKRRIYTSVTTFIGMYHEKFDKAYWLPYKALQSIVTKDEWAKANRTYKKDKNGKSKPMLKHLRKLVGEDAYQASIKVIDGQWVNTNKAACDRGSIIHKSREDAYMAAGSHVLDDKVYMLGTDHKLDLEDGIYPELLMYDAEYLLSGQADRVIKEGRYVDIHDYKTNKKLDRESYLDKVTGLRRSMMKPVDYLMDCNMIHYYLQLSLYAWILERQGFIPRKLTIEHIDHEGKVTFIDVPYLKDSIEALTSHWKRYKMNKLETYIPLTHGEQI